MAVPLTRYLSLRGSYEGLDIVNDGIEWCTRNITSRYPNFHFWLADVQNTLYNPGGGKRAAEYRLPYVGEAFDFVFLASVFTHMLPSDMENYLHEIARVLKPDGRTLVTFFLLNSESRALIAANCSTQVFSYGDGVCRLVDPEHPEAAVGYDEAFVRARYVENRLRILEPVRYGSWPGRPDFTSYQDIIVAARE
jgi:SAM-dependent methyltransferase